MTASVRKIAKIRTGGQSGVDRAIPCISLEGQKVFHSGYESREKDLHDIRILNMITK